MLPANQRFMPALQGRTWRLSNKPVIRHNALQVTHKELSAAPSCTGANSVCGVWAELLVGVFRDYSGLRLPIADEIIHGVLPNMDCQRRSFPVADYNIHMASALILQLLQVMLVMCRSNSCNMFLEADMSRHARSSLWLGKYLHIKCCTRSS